MQSTFVAPPPERPDAAPRAGNAEASPRPAPGPRFADLLQQRRDAAASSASAEQAAAGKADAAQAPGCSGAGAAADRAGAQRAQDPDERDARTSDDDASATDAASAAPAAEAGSSKPRKQPARARAEGDDTSTGAPSTLAGAAAARALAQSAPGAAGSGDAADGNVRAPGARARSALAVAPNDGPGAKSGTPGADPSAVAAASDSQGATTAQTRSAPHMQAGEGGTATPVALAGPHQAAVASPGVATVALPTPLHAPQFAETLGAQLSLFARDGVQQAELRLNPPEMGPIGVQIDLDGSNARVDFHAAHAATRELIERALPELAAALRSEGLTLAGGGVFDRPADARDSFDGQRGTASRRSNGDHVSAPPAAPLQTFVPQGALDLYA